MWDINPKKNLSGELISDPHPLFCIIADEISIVLVVESQIIGEISIVQLQKLHQLHTSRAPWPLSALPEMLPVLLLELSPPAPSPTTLSPLVLELGRAPVLVPVLVPWPPPAVTLAEGAGAVAAVPLLEPSLVDVVDGKSPGSCCILDKLGMGAQHQVPQTKNQKFE